MLRTALRRSRRVEDCVDDLINQPAVRPGIDSAEFPKYIIMRRFVISEAETSGVCPEMI